jgi:low affinity Fe/Cu permease
MELIYMIFIAVIGIIVAIGVGLEISKEIDEFTVSMLFWILYIITIITFINIVLVWNYYQNMKGKKGPIGSPGEMGDRGEKGDTGLCDANCRDSICENALNELITDELKERNNGVIIKMNNVYIKSKIRQMCASDEFKQLAPYNGNLNLNNYLKTIWKEWFNLLFEQGGLSYFQTIGAETEFEWLKENPFDEMKKYDVFYWGMGKQYRPQLVDKCYNSRDGVTPDDNASQYMIRVSPSNFYKKLIEVTNKSDANETMSVWRANQFTYKNNVFYPVGDVVVNTSRNKNIINNTYKKVGEFEVTNLVGPSINTIIVSGDVKSPINYELLWTNKTERGNHFWVWRPIPPTGYIALGDIITTSSLKPDTGENAPLRCIPKDITQLTEPSPQSVVWSSQGIRTSLDNKISLISTPTHNYIFKGVKGNNLTIPKSDTNGSFYTLLKDKYDSNFVIGRDYGNPDTSDIANRVGKGYIPSPQKDAKYSIMSYVNLKNNATLTHSITSKIINCNLIPNAIGNAYLVKNNEKCLDFVNNKLTNSECDELIDSQIFSIVFTGNKKNQCQLRHYQSKKLLIFNKNGNRTFTLIDENDSSNHQHTLFIMD